MKYLLFVFVQSGLQQIERVHQPRGKAALFSRSSSEPLPLGQGPVQIKLLLSLFADQLSLSGTCKHKQTFKMFKKKKKREFFNIGTNTASHLADEPGDEQEHQDAVVISAVTEEGVRHEGGEERHLLV